MILSTFMGTFSKRYSNFYAWLLTKNIGVIKPLNVEEALLGEVKWRDGKCAGE